MSCTYAEGLSPYENKGKLGLPETFDPEPVVEEKVDQLFRWLRESRHVVFYTGAGISTSAGIPDFRGPKGVWTLEKKGLKPDINVSWNDAKPTKSHMAISKLVDLNKAHFVISQNIDGLHLRSGLTRDKVAELHGDMFVEACNTCKRMFVRSTAATTVGQKCLGTSCPQTRGKGRPCRGKLCDFVLDWEAALPDNDLDLSNAHSTLADLSIVIGSTLQIIPAGTMPTLTKKFHGDQGKLVIINLQPTKQDKKADLIIRTFADSVMEKLFEKLGLDIPEYNSERDPIVSVKSLDYLDWTQSDEETKRVVTLAEKVEAEFKERKKVNKGKKKVEPKKAEPVAKPVKERTIPKKGIKKANAKSVEPLKTETAIGSLESLKNEIKTEENSSDLAMKKEENGIECENEKANLNEVKNEISIESEQNEITKSHKRALENTIDSEPIPKALKLEV